jgi:hypothetical protein
MTAASSTISFNIHPQYKKIKGDKLEIEIESFCVGDLSGGTKTCM